MIRLAIAALAVIASCLTMRAAMDLHCRISCVDDGEDGGFWNEQTKTCKCFYERMPAMKLRGELLRKNREEKKEEPTTTYPSRYSLDDP